MGTVLVGRFLKWPGNSQMEPDEYGVRYPPNISGIGKWRMEIKEQLFFGRGWHCEYCGAAGIDLHEGIVSRGDMRGFTDEQKVIAFACVNLFILCMECNREHPPSREWAWNKSCERYSEATMRRWYRSLNLKAPRREWL